MYRGLVAQFLTELLNRQDNCLAIQERDYAQEERAALGASAECASNDEDTPQSFANDLGDHLSPVTRGGVSAPNPAKSVCDLLIQVKGHGSETFLSAARRLVDDGVDSTAEIDRWYREYGELKKKAQSGCRSAALLEGTIVHIRPTKR